MTGNIENILLRTWLLAALWSIVVIALFPWNEASATGLMDRFAPPQNPWTRFSGLNPLRYSVLWLCGLWGITYAGRRAREIQASMQALAHRTERYELAMNGASSWVWDLDRESGHLYLPPHMASVLGWKQDELPHHFGDWLTRIHPDDRQSVEQTVWTAKAGQYIEQSYRVGHDDQWHWLKSRSQVVRSAGGKAVRVVGTCVDITLQKQWESHHAAEAEQAKRLLASIGDAVLSTDAEGNVTYMNPVAEHITGWRLSEAEGMPVEAVLPLYDEKTRAPADGPITRCMQSRQVVMLTDHTILINRHGGEIAIGDSAAPVLDDENRLIGAVMVFRDETRLRDMSRQMAWQLSHDSLTGLVSRHEFERNLQVLLEDARANGNEHALLFLDLDQFKLVNDTGGHIAGNELIKQLSQRLVSQLRRNDILARLGGDEFGALLERCPAEKALEIAEKLRNTVKGFHFAWQNRVFNVGVSIGLVMVTQDASSVADILSCADVACYTAKDDGRNRVHLYREDDQERAKKQRDIQVVSDIRSALAESKFTLFGQTLLAMKETERSHFEVLLRMPDRYGLFVSPALFIPAAERYGVMPDVDRWVVRHALEMLARYTNQHVDLSINLSGASFQEEGMLEYIRDEINRIGIDPTRITFEITETAAVAHLASGVRFMHSLKTMGCRFALDDFGVGMSSFAYLKALPVDSLKIDGTFVRDMLINPFNHAIVKTINDLGQIMGKETVAEYVEDEALLEELRRIGVDHAQGYVICKPRPLESLLYEVDKPSAVEVLQ